MNPLAFAIDPSLVLKAMGKPPDPWQKQVLLSKENMLILCHRQAGKDTTVGVKAAAVACFESNALVIILCPTQRQAAETLRKCMDAYWAMNAPAEIKQHSVLYLELSNGSRILALPGKEATVRGYSAVRLLIINEASKVPDDLYRTVRPMVAISQGQIICMTTPFGRQGFFYKEWISDNKWVRIQQTADKCPRLDKSFLDAERASMGESWFNQEYMCAFDSVRGLVYPRFRECIIEQLPSDVIGYKVGGIDFGFNSPFAGVWGYHDAATDTLYITNERYLRHTNLSDHRDALKDQSCRWWCADSAGATEIRELRSAGLTIYESPFGKDIKAGILAMQARIETGRLKILASCENLIAEGSFYHYPDVDEAKENEKEKPVGLNDHAMDALRYLITRLDRVKIAQFRKKAGQEGYQYEDHAPLLETPTQPTNRIRPWLHPENDALFEMLN